MDASLKARNRRTGLVVAAVALGFFVAVVLRRTLLG